MSVSINDLEKQIQSADSDQARAHAQSELAWILSNRDPDKSMELSQAAYETATRDEILLEVVADSLRTQAVLRFHSGDYDESLSHAFQALTSYQDLKLPEGQSLILGLIARIYESLGNEPEALVYAFEALNLSESHDDRLGIASCLELIGTIYHRMKDYEDALDVYGRALQIFRELGRTGEMATIFCRIGRANHALNRHYESLNYARQALEMAQSTGHGVLEADTLVLMGRVYGALDQFDNAFFHGQQAVAIAQRLGLVTVEIEASNYVSILYQRQGNSESALVYLRRALHLSEIHDLKLEQRDCHQHLVSVYRSTGLFELALQHYEQYHGLVEAINQERENKRLHHLQIIHRTESARREAEMVEAQHATLTYEILEKKRAELGVQEANRILQKRIEELSTLNEISLVLGSSDDFLNSLGYVSSLMREQLEVQGIWIGVHDRSVDQFRLVGACWRGRDIIPTNRKIPFEEIAPVKQLLHDGGATIVNPELARRLCLTAFKPGTTALEFGDVLCVPLRARREVIGLLGLVAPFHRFPLSDADQRFVETAAGQIAVSLENIRLLKDEQHLRQVAEKRNRELDTFARTVAHNLKDPLSALVGSTKFLIDYHQIIDAQKASEMVTVIHNSGQKALNIIEELLLLAGLGRHKVSVHPIDMALVIAQSLERLRMFADRYEGEVTLPEQWPIAIGYAPWLEEVWVNYISNGIKYGGRPYQIELGATILDDDRIRFWVKDNGPGLEPAELDELFSAFWRAAPEVADGHGLGLSIVKQIMDKLGGEVGCESVVGQGSTFYFTLPRAMRG